MKHYRDFNKEHFLSKFMNQGFYLIDVVKCPIDKLPKDEKEKAIVSCTQYLRNEVDSLIFNRIIVIGKSSFRIVRRSLDPSFDPVVISLPFGSQRNVEDYMSELKRNLIYHGYVHDESGGLHAKNTC